ncbi:helix-turn-helix domain-containing protein [Lentzea sp. NPDC051208]|uniref:helix-turn-helix domain-containing protein n=1 Tax=Lentzea sp. NPDC051208 TaxID=3154642 RepID=UPI00342728A6
MPANILSGTTDANRTPRLVQRTCAILRALSEGGTVSSMTALSASTGIPRATVHRLVRALQDERVIVRTSSGYRLTAHLPGIIAFNDQEHLLADRARPLMLEIFERTHLLIQLMILDGDLVRCVDQFDIAQHTTTRGSGRGTRWLASRVAAGRAVLEGATGSASVPSCASGLVVALDRGATQPGLVTMAVSLGVLGRIPAAISVSGTLQQVSDRQVAMVLRKVVHGGGRWAVADDPACRAS